MAKDLRWFTGNGGCSGEGPRIAFTATSLEAAQDRGWGNPTGPYANRQVAKFAIEHKIFDPTEANHLYDESRRDR